MVVPSEDKYRRYLTIVAQIDEAIRIVRDDTSLHSSTKPIINHPEFKKLVAMGDSIVPYLFHRMSHFGSDWVSFLLLSRITSINPVSEEHRGNFYWAIHDWFGWYLQSEYYAIDNIYHGLIGEEVEV